jgi:hypothetical protein
LLGGGVFDREGDEVGLGEFVRDEVGLGVLLRDAVGGGVRDRDGDGLQEYFRSYCWFRQSPCWHVWL